MVCSTYFDEHLTSLSPPLQIQSSINIYFPCCHLYFYKSNPVHCWQGAVRWLCSKILCISSINHQKDYLDHFEFGISSPLKTRWFSIVKFDVWSGNWLGCSSLKCSTSVVLRSSEKKKTKHLDLLVLQIYFNRLLTKNKHSFSLCLPLRSQKPSVNRILSSAAVMPLREVWPFGL